MNLFFRVLCFLSLYSSSLLGVELPEGVEEEEKTSVVSVLCYHDFSATREATEMRIKEDAFAQQMKAVKDSGVNVISLKEFQQWKSGQLELPEENVMITIDDGWRSVYQVAFPILSKHEFPFVLGLYKDFIAKGELSLELEMIQEMLENGMEIASHSVTHPFPSKVKKEREQGTETYEKFLKKELGASKGFLEQKFGSNIVSYIYPGGYYSEDMFPILRFYGYEYAFTVKPGKITRDSKDLELPRYVVLGTTSHLFKQAMRFKTEASYQAGNGALLYPVKPVPGGSIQNRRPWIGVDFSEVEDLDRENIKMSVSGFGEVLGTFIPDTDRFEWNARRSLRAPSYEVTVQWKLKSKNAYEEPLKWSFNIDHQAEYVKAAEGK